MRSLSNSAVIASRKSRGQGQTPGGAIKDANGWHAIHSYKLECLGARSNAIRQESKKPLGLQSVQGSSGQHQLP